MKEGLNIKYLSSFYEFLWVKKSKELLIFLLIIFVSSLLPYIIVALNLDYKNQKQLKSYYGDGSILTLCSGILLSYYTIFFKKENDDDKINDNILIVVVLVFIYAIVVLQFYFCQMATERDLIMIIKVIFGSTVLLILTLCVTAFLHFREKVAYTDIQNYINEKNEKKLSQKANKTNNTEDGMKL